MNITNITTWFNLLLIIISATLSGIIVARVIPVVNRMARNKGILNITNDRTSHRYATPNLGGISVFFAVFCTSIVFAHTDFGEFLYLFWGCMILFFVGVQDDIFSISPLKKFLTQLFVATVLAFYNIRIIHLFGFLGIEQLSEIGSFFVTLFAIVFVVNAINLIDGIDGLLATLGIVMFFAFGFFFFYYEKYSLAVFCASLIGALFVFLQYNVRAHRNKTFMGDCGSLFIGLCAICLAIEFLETNASASQVPLFPFRKAPAIAFSVLLIPVFDACRVFFYRILHGRSPFSPDRNHLHHRIIDIGFKHFDTSLILGGASAFFILISFALSFFIGMIWIMLTQLGLMIAGTLLVEYFYWKEGRKEGRKARNFLIDR